MKNLYKNHGKYSAFCEIIYGTKNVTIIFYEILEKWRTSFLTEKSTYPSLPILIFVNTY